MSKAKSWIRPGLHTVTPRLIFKNAQKAVDLYVNAFGATIRGINLSPDGQRVLHGEIQIGDSVIYVVDEVPNMGCISPETSGAPGATLALSVENADAVFIKAVESGCTVKMPVGDMFWGDRFGVVKDPFGNTWEIATHIEDLTTEEVQRRAKEAFRQMTAAK